MTLRWFPTLACVLWMAGPALAQDGSGTAATGRTQDVERLVGPTGVQVLESLRAEPRGFVGVRLVNLTDGLRRYFRVPGDLGVLVAEVEPDGPAHRAGLQAGDVVTRLDGDEIGSSEDLSRGVAGRRSGDRVSVDYIRDGRAASVELVVEERRPVVVRLSPRFVQQRSERGGAGEPLSETEFEFAADQLQLLFSSDGLRHKIDRLEKLDLRAMEERIRQLEGQIETLERQLASSQPPRGDER